MRCERDIIHCDQKFGVVILDAPQLGPLRTFVHFAKYTLLTCTEYGGLQNAFYKLPQIMALCKVYLQTFAKHGSLQSTFYKPGKIQRWQQEGFWSYVFYEGQMHQDFLSTEVAFFLISQYTLPVAVTRSRETPESGRHQSGRRFARLNLTERY